MAFNRKSLITSCPASINEPPQVFDILSKDSSLNKDEWLTTTEAAAFLKVSEKSLLNACSNGQVPFRKFNRRNRYLKSELHNLLLSSTKRGSYGN